MPTPSNFEPIKFAPPSSRGPVNRSYWLEIALGSEGSLPVERLEEDISVDVCIVGGGYTGLWTALELKKREPGLSIAVVEADLCGSGASGRNGGFVMSWWSKFGTLRKLCGESEALRLARGAEASIDAIEQFCDASDISSAFSRGGWLWVATNDAQVGAWQTTLDLLQESGVNPYTPVSRPEVAEMIDSGQHLEGVFEPNVGLVQPAVLARRLAQVARDQGVMVMEQSPVRSLQPGSPNVVATGRGKVSAERVVLAMNSWAVQIPPLAQALMVVSSDVVATEPIPEQLHELGWDPGLAISDSRRLINYYRLSSDSRLVFGKAGGTIAHGPKVPTGFNGRSPRETELGQHIARLFPTLADVSVTNSWRGPIDYSITALPFFHRVANRPDIITVVGYSGNGVGPSHFAATMLAAKVLDPSDESVPAPLDRIPSRKLPPEPLRYIGARVVRAATGRKEMAEDMGRKPGSVSRALAALDPTSVIDRGESK